MMTPLPTLSRRSRNNVNGSIGCVLRRSQRTNAVSATTAITLAPSTCVAVQPSSPPWMIANTSAPNPARDSVAPTGSSGVLDSSRDSGAYIQMATNVSATSGRFTSTAEPHQYRSRSAPDTIGPIAPPAPANPAHTAIARVRSSGGKMVVMIDNVAGITSAAPIPMTARPTITCSAADAIPASSEPDPKTTSPASNARLRPKRSPSAPATSNDPANTIAYASRIHWICDADALSSSCIVGIAVTSPDTDITTSTRDRHIIASRNQRRPWMLGSSCNGRARSETRVGELIVDSFTAGGGPLGLCDTATYCYET